MKYDTVKKYLLHRVEELENQVNDLYEHSKIEYTRKYSEETALGSAIKSFYSVSLFNVIEGDDGVEIANIIQVASAESLKDAMTLVNHDVFRNFHPYTDFKYIVIEKLESGIYYHQKDKAKWFYERLYETSDKVVEISNPKFENLIANLHGDGDGFRVL